MGWVKEALQQLKEKDTCQVRPIGGSMKGKIESGQLVSIQKINGALVKVEDIIFIKWKNNYLLHIAKEVKNDEILIGNNLGKINGWIPKENVIGKVIQIHEEEL